jgi:ABC-type glycerol-3-phosphate transport system substrate-binding protein
MTANLARTAALALVAALLAAGCATPGASGSAHVHPGSAPSGAPAATGGMNRHGDMAMMKQMRQQMAAAKTDAERQAIMADHMEMMQAMMESMKKRMDSMHPR